MFVAILTYKTQLEEVDRHLQAHRDYLAGHYAADIMMANGSATLELAKERLMMLENDAPDRAEVSYHPNNLYFVCLSPIGK